MPAPFQAEVTKIQVDRDREPSRRFYSPKAVKDMNTDLPELFKAWQASTVELKWTIPILASRFSLKCTP